LSFCRDCDKDIRKCPICRAAVGEKIKVYLS
jgi:hypothetical protein